MREKGGGLATYKLGKLSLESTSAPFACTIYTIFSFVVLIIFRFIYPDFDVSSQLLDDFWVKARFTRGVLTFIDLFPAVFMSALTIPFALKIHSGSSEKRFSMAFFDSLKPHLACCIAGTIVYTFLSLIAMPLLTNYELRLQSESRLYTTAREKAAEFAEKEQWLDAAMFYSICEYILPEAAAKDSLAETIASGVERLRYGRENSAGAKKTPPMALPGYSASLNENEALALAKKAFQNGRYYDAHWLANTAERLAKPSSTEAADAARTASLAWNAISRMEPTSDEERLFSIYRRKREGYEALVNGEWLRSYYIFTALLNDAPNDTDVQNYYSLSKQGVSSVAFFLDEIDTAAGNTMGNVIFSLPASDKGGRIVLRIETLTLLEDAAFGRGVEAISFSPQNILEWRLSSELVKILPMSINGQWRTALILHAVDRTNPSISKKPVWTGRVPTAAEENQLLLSLSFEELQLAAQAQQGGSGFFLSDLWLAAHSLGENGFIPEVFYVRIVRVLAQVIFFPALAIIAIVIGWKYRAKFHVRYAFYPMLVVLPLVVSLIGVLLRAVIHAVAVWAVISFGISSAMLIFITTAIISFAVCVFFLAAQRGK